MGEHHPTSADPRANSFADTDSGFDCVTFTERLPWRFTCANLRVSTPIAKRDTVSNGVSLCIADQLPGDDGKSHSLGGTQTVVKKTHEILRRACLSARCRPDLRTRRV